MIEGESMTVLVVEDDEDTRANLQDILELDGYRVETAGTVHEALKPRDWSDVMAVIIDRRLPDGSAESLMPELKRLAPASDLIVATGFADLEGAIAALRNGASDYIVKPINPTLLRAAVARNIERRRLTRAKVRSEAAFRTLVDAAPTLTIILRMNGAISYMNPFAEDLTGFSIGDAQGRDFTTLFGESLARRRLIEQAADDDRRAEMPARGLADKLRCKGGRQISIAWNADVLDDFDGAPAILAIGHDVTELHEAQRKALQSERLAAIGQMMTGLTHESRNALQRSKACLEMLTLEVEDRPAALDLVRRIENAQNHLQLLYEEVRTYAAPINLKTQICDLRDLWRQTWSHLESLRREKKAELQEEIESDDRQCRIDPYRIEQLFRNILENALSAIPVGGHVSVRCEPAEIEGRPALRIAFCDDGPGLTAEQRQHIFEPFYTTKTKGTGLGMAIAKRIVQSHGGLLEVSDRSCPGAELVVTLPR